VSAITEIKAGIAACFESVADLQAHERIPDNIPTSPAFFLRSGPADYDDTMDGASTWNVDLVLVVDRADETRQDILDDYADPAQAGSIVAMIDADRTLGGRVDDTKVASVGEISGVTVGSDEFYSRTFRIVVLA
jgi:hypothetical protein